MLGAFQLAAGMLGAPFGAAARPRITPPTRATILAYKAAAAVLVRTSDAGIVDRETDAQIGPTLG